MAENKKNNISISTEEEKYKKSNVLINAKGKTSLMGLRLFALGMNYASMDEETKTIVSEIPVKKLKELLHSKSNSLYDKVFDLTVPSEDSEDSEDKDEKKKKKKRKNTLLDWRIIAKDPVKQEFRAMNVIQDTEYKDGYLVIRYNNSINNELWDLKSNYTVLNLNDTMKLKSKYSAQLYEMLKSNYDFLRTKYHRDENISWKVNVVELQLRLGVINAEGNKTIFDESRKEKPDYDKIDKIAIEKGLKKYKEFGAFNQFVLKKSIKEINEKTVIDVKIDPKGSGRGGKKKEILFIISYKKNNLKEDLIGNIIVPKELTEEQKFDAIIEIGRIVKGVSSSEVKAIAEAADYQIDKVIEAYQLAEKSKKIDGITGWMIDAVKEGWAEKKSISPKNNKDKFKNFKEREYDYDDLEKRFSKN